MLSENTWQDYTRLDSNFKNSCILKVKKHPFIGMLFWYCIGIFCKILKVMQIVIIASNHRPKASLAVLEVKMVAVDRDQQKH